MNKFLNSCFVKNWWPFLVTVDLFLIAFTVANPYISDFSQKWRLITPFSLHTENNLAVWWSGITLLLAALLAYQRAIDKGANALPWLALSFVLACFSLDEMGSFHERIGHLKGWSGIYPYAIILTALIAYAIIKLFRSEQTITNAKYLCIATILFFSVALQEYIEHAYTWQPWMLGIRVGTEEGTELLATLFILLAIIYKKEQPRHLLTLLPKPNSISNLKLIAALGLLTHVIGSYLITKYGDPFFRGNPMNWYPTVIYFCIALICFSKMLTSFDPTIRTKLGTASILFTITSIGIMTNLFMIILPGINKIIDPTIVSKNFTIVYLIQLVTFIILLNKRTQISRSAAMYSLIFISALLWLDFYIENAWIRYSILGVLSYSTFYIFTFDEYKKTEDLATRP